jgi:hypothetical protein
MVCALHLHYSASWLPDPGIRLMILDRQSVIADRGDVVFAVNVPRLPRPTGLGVRLCYSLYSRCCMKTASSLGLGSIVGTVYEWLESPNSANMPKSTTSVRNHTPRARDLLPAIRMSLDRVPGSRFQIPGF